MKSFYLLIILISIQISSVYAQELNAKVTINAEKIQLTDKTIFNEMAKSCTEFLNNRKWTNDQYQVLERISCNFFLNITEMVGSDVFRAEVSIQSTRQAYGSNYNTVVFYNLDKDWQFQYSNFQNFEFNENQFTNNFSSLLAFYAYTIIGMDYDSYGLDGGNPYFIKAQQIVNNASTATETGWQALNGTANKNRYWLIENILNARYKSFHDAIYTYHRKGIDYMYKDIDAARKEITSALTQLKNVSRLSPNLYLLQLFFFAKSDEIINIYKDALPADKNKIVELLNEISVQNSNKWQQILGK